MKNKHKKRIKRVVHREHTKLLGGKPKADKFRRAAADLRFQHSLCPCGDEEKHYLSEEEADADKTPNVICDECGKPKLRVAVIAGVPLCEFGQLAIIDLLR